MGVFETALFPKSIFVEDQYNPALDNCRRFHIVAGAESKFQLPELRAYYLCSSLKSYHLSINSMGSELYRENMLKFSRCFWIQQIWTVGFSIALLNNWVKDNFNRYTYALCLNGSMRVERFKISGWVNNLNSPRLSHVDLIPVSYSIRFDYEPKQTVNIALAVRGMKKDMPFFNIGILFSPYDIVEMGTAVNTDPVYLEYILRLHIGDFTLVYAGSNHQYLGLSHAFSMQFWP
jgi:hypothetical protein